MILKNSSLNDYINAHRDVLNLLKGFIKEYKNGHLNLREIEMKLSKVKN